MSDKSSTRLIGLCSLLLVIGFTLVLTGCAPSFYDTKHTTAPLDSDRDPALHSHPLFAQATASPTVVTLPEAGGPRPTNQLSSPTSLPPTTLPTTPTATPTQVPATRSPTPVPHFAPTRIVIPAINLDAPVMAVGWTVTEQNGQKVSEWNVPSDRMVGWLNTSALVGVPGNTVLVGHQNVDGRVFENLEYLQPGDEIQLQAGDELHKYTMVMRTIVPEKDQPLEVRLENARWIGRSNDERLTLITCWPRNDNTHRLILVALPAP